MGTRADVRIGPAIAGRTPRNRLSPCRGQRHTARLSFSSSLVSLVAYLTFLLSLVKCRHDTRAPFRPSQRWRRDNRPGLVFGESACSPRSPRPSRYMLHLAAQTGCFPGRAGGGSGAPERTESGAHLYGCNRRSFAKIRVGTAPVTPVLHTDETTSVCVQHGLEWQMAWTKSSCTSIQARGYIPII